MARQLQRVAVLVLGWTLIGFGVIGLFLPVLQGILFLALGLYVLSRESRWARRHFDRLKARFPGLEEKIHALRDRLHRRRHPGGSE